MKQIQCLTCNGRGFVMVKNPVEELAMTVLMSVASQYDVSVQAIQGRSRAPDISRARSEAMMRMRDAGMMLKEIGQWVGHRDHSTVLNNIKLARFHTPLSTEPAMQGNGA